MKKDTDFTPKLKELGNIVDMCRRYDVPVEDYLKNSFPELFEKPTRKFPGRFPKHQMKNSDYNKPGNNPLLNEKKKRNFGTRRKFGRGKQQQQ